MRARSGDYRQNYIEMDYFKGHFTPSGSLSGWSDYPFETTRDLKWPPNQLISPPLLLLGGVVT